MAHHLQIPEPYEQQHHGGQEVINSDDAFRDGGGVYHEYHVLQDRDRGAYHRGALGAQFEHFELLKTALDDGYAQRERNQTDRGADEKIDYRDIRLARGGAGLQREHVDEQEQQRACAETD